MSPKKWRNKVLHIEKKVPMIGGGEKGPLDRNVYFFQGCMANAYSCFPLRAPLDESDYTMHNIFGNFSSHIYIKTHSRMQPVQLFL